MRKKVYRVDSLSEPVLSHIPEETAEDKANWLNSWA